jgi:hypothetical protein
VVDVCYLLHSYQLHVSALMAIFRFNELTKKTYAVIFGMRLIYRGVGGGGIVWGYDVACVCGRAGWGCMGSVVLT